MSKKFSVTLPIAGHAFLIVEADSEDDAIQKAMAEVTSEDLDSWEAIEQFNEGNVCYCPRPWNAEATAEDDDYGIPG